MKKTLLVFLFLFSIVCFTNIQTSAASTVAKGKCGKNATWILSEDGVMHIKGKGILKGEKNGWNKYQYKIKKIVIGKGITIIKETALASMHNVKEITMLDSQAFVDCLGLTTIVNRSNKSLRLDDCKGKKKWKVNGKKAKILPGKKTAKTKKITFKITYDLRGGETMGELPSSYCYGEKVDLPDVVKPGYQFLGWKYFHLVYFLNIII